MLSFALILATFLAIGVIGSRQDAARAARGAESTRDHLIWRRFLTGDASITGTHVSRDPRGGLFVAGEACGKELAGHAIADDCDGFIAHFGPTGQRDWVRLLGLNGPSPSDLVAADDGTLYVVGSAWGGRVGDERVQGLVDGFVAKLTPDGTIAWSHLIGTPKIDGSYGVVLRDDGSVVVLSALGGGRVSRWSDPLRHILSRYNADGQFLGSSPVGGRRESVIDLEVTDRGFVTAGWVCSRPAGQRSCGSLHGAVASYGFDGAMQWRAILRSPGRAHLSDVAVSETGALFAVGSGGADCDFSNSPDFCDVVVTRLSRAGKVLWTRTLGGDRWDAGAGIAILAGDRVLIAGKQSIERRDPPEITERALVGLFDASGHLLWSKTWGRHGPDYAFDAAGAADGESAYVVGASARGPTHPGIGIQYDLVLTKYR